MGPYFRIASGVALVFAVSVGATQVHSADPNTSAPMPSDDASGYYVVKQDDTLYRIALVAGQSYRDLMDWNGLASAQDIHVGQSIRINPPAGWVPNEAAREAKRQAIAREREVQAAEFDTKHSGQTSNADEQAVSGGALGFVTQLLGAAAQGVASAGGRNAAQYQAIATALQTTSGTASPSSTKPVPQPVPTTSPGSYGGTSGGNSATGARKTTGPVNNCITQVRIPRGSKGHVGWYEVETGLTNKCGYTVNVAWCVTGLTSKDINGAARCEQQYSGMYEISPGEQLSMQVDRFGSLESLVCKSPARPLNIQWSGARFTGQCVLL
jgi:LysM repeat protein